MRLFRTLALAVTIMLPAASAVAQGILYKNPQCGCCESHAEHLRQSGLEVTSVATHDLALLRQSHGVPIDLVGCHMLVIGGYVVEGHVPASVVHRLLAERPAITGISLPGMPIDSPGMDGPKTEPFTVYAFGGDDESRVYAVE